MRVVFSLTTITCCCALFLTGMLPSAESQTRADQLCGAETSSPQPDGHPIDNQTVTTPKAAPSAASHPPWGQAFRRLLTARQKLGSAVSHNASSAQKRFEQLNALYRYPSQFPATDTPRVHAVGYHYGPNDGPVNVRVDDTSGPVVLILSGYYEITWNVEVGRDVTLDLIIATGYRKQTVVDSPCDVPIVNRSYRRGDYAYGYGGDPAKWEQLTTWVHDQIGFPVTTVLGNYYAPEEDIVVGPQNVDWRMQMINQL